MGQVVDLSQCIGDMLDDHRLKCVRAQELLDTPALLTELQRQHYKAYLDSVRPWMDGTDGHWVAALNEKNAFRADRVQTRFDCRFMDYEETYFLATLEARAIPQPTTPLLEECLNTEWPSLLGDPVLLYRTRLLLVPVRAYLQSLVDQGYRYGTCTRHHDRLNIRASLSRESEEVQGSLYATVDLGVLGRFAQQMFGTTASLANS